MSTLFDPVKVRRLAASGDAFWKGAAWVLDQQDAARIDPTDYDNAWGPVSNDEVPSRAMIDDLAGKFTRNPADLGAPRVP